MRNSQENMAKGFGTGQSFDAAMNNSRGASNGSRGSHNNSQVSMNYSN
jgi:hypothetical protein